MTNKTIEFSKLEQLRNDTIDTFNALQTELEGTQQALYGVGQELENITKELLAIDPEYLD
jgi:hypothetical protein